MPECVYFIDTADGRFVKIGYSRNISTRFSDLKVSSPHPLTLRGWVYGGRKLESALHTRFRYLRSNGEWFKRTAAFDEYVESLNLNEPAEIPTSEPLVSFIPDLRYEVGHISDLVGTKQRADWSALNKKIKDIEPGSTLVVTCPLGLSISRFRSTILTAGARIHKGDWKLCTRASGRKISCFLAPTQPTS